MLIVVSRSDGSGEDRARVTTDTYAVCQLDDELSLLDILDQSVEATRRDDAVVDAERFTLLL